MRNKLLFFSLLICLFIIPSEAVTLKFNGEVNMRAKYTPETKLAVERKLFLTSRVEVGQNMIGTIGFKGLNQYEWQPIFAATEDLDLAIDRLSITTNAPLYRGWPSVLTTIGDVELNYSPYVFRIDDSSPFLGKQINPRKRGISISGFKVPTHQNLFLDACVVWDKDNSPRYSNELLTGPSNVIVSKDGLGQAAKLLYEVDGGFWTITGAGFSGKLARPLSQYTSNCDRYTLDEQTWLVEFARNEQKVKYQLIAGSNSRNYQYYDTILNGQATKRDDLPLSIASKGQLLLAEMGWTLDQVSIKTGYQFVEPEFDPEYRDRTPRYDEEGKRLAWNPVDRLLTEPGIIYGTYEQMYDPSRFYMGRQGGYIALKSKLGEGYLEGSANIFRAIGTKSDLETKYKVLTGSLEVPLNQFLLASTVERVIKQQYRADGFSNDARTSFIRTEISKPITNMVSALGWYQYEDIFEEPSSMISRGVALDINVSSGKLVGLKGQIGIDWEKKSGAEVLNNLAPMARFTYQLPNGFVFRANWRSPGRAVQKVYDRWGKVYLGEDNLIEGRIQVVF